jgi:hypothetical protein
MGTLVIFEVHIISMIASRLEHREEINTHNKFLNPFVRNGISQISKRETRLGYRKKSMNSNRNPFGPILPKLDA